MKIRLVQIDAFTDTVFSGNPAAVCPLESWLPDQTLLAIAAENNLSETAFFVTGTDGIELRWFTPTVEVDLCGHATLATAHFIFSETPDSGDELVFQTRKAGPLTVRREGDRLEMDFPARPARPAITPPTLPAALGAQPAQVLAGRDLLAVFEDPAIVRNLTPDFRALAKLDAWAVIVTAPGDDCDFVSRFFAPGHGIDEDPVTGSAHCALIPYWAKRLGKTEMTARQLSRRGGQLFCRAAGERVGIAGRAVTYLDGWITL